MKDFFGRDVSTHSENGMTTYMVHGDDNSYFTVEFPDEISLERVMSTINSMAPIGYDPG